MADTHGDSRLSRLKIRCAFLKESVPLIAIWPVICAIAIFVLWHLTITKINADQEAINQIALKDAAAIAQTSAHHMTRTIEQVDQITQFIGYQWRQGEGKLKLEELLKVSIFPPSLLNYVAVIDRNGVPVTSTISIQAGALVSHDAYFLFHKFNVTDDLRISKPELSQASGRPVILFTRRLYAANGSFDGVVLVSVETATLSGFFSDSSMGSDHGLLAIVGQDGVIRMSRTGNGDDKDTEPALRGIPSFGSSRGAALLDGKAWFVDGRGRFVGWHPLTGYPITVFAGIDEEKILLPHQAAWRNYKQAAVAGSLLLILFALTGSVLSMRLAWRKHQADEIRDSYRLATESGEEGFFRVGAIHSLQDRSRIVDFMVEDCNERGAVFFGQSRMQLIGSKFSDLLTRDDFDATLKIYREAMELGSYDGDFSVPPGSPLQAAWIHRRLIRSGSGLAVTLRDISHTKAHERELSRMANEDALTNLPNRHWLMNTLPIALTRAAASNTMLALLFMDLNKFKGINDTFGHAVGDELLHAVALRLKSALRPTDNVVRHGGDEFVVILEPVVSRENAAEVAERIADAFIEPFKLSPGKKYIGASIGISLFPTDGDHVEALLKAADIAMYASKEAAQVRYCFYEPELDRKLKAKRENEQALVRAVEQDQFVVFYQPRIDACTGELRSMEALVRWMHPDHGLIKPIDFISLAEDTGIIIKIGQLVMEKTCAQLAKWKAQNLPLVPVSINLSARQFDHGDMKQLCVATLSRYRIDPSLIELEIPESSMKGEQADIDLQLSALRDYGIRLLLGDFGTGYSSLSRLQRLNMDVLKIDRTFTAELGNSDEGEMFFKAIISMAHALGMIVVAEGVETLEQFRLLQALSCDEIQGFLISLPLPAAEMSELMRGETLLPVLYA